jgi:hypothetical protein
MLPSLAAYVFSTLTESFRQRIDEILQQNPTTGRNATGSSGGVLLDQLIAAYTVTNNFALTVVASLGLQGTLRYTACDQSITTAIALMDMITQMPLQALQLSRRKRW